MNRQKHLSFTRGIALVLTLLLLVTGFPVTVFAAEVPTITVTFPEPSAGNSAANAPALTCEQGYTVEWVGYYPSNGEATVYTGIFEAGETYVATFNLYLPKGDTFTNSGNYTVNGTKVNNLLSGESTGLSGYLDVGYGDLYGAAFAYSFTIPSGSGTQGGTKSGGAQTPSSGSGTQDANIQGSTAAVKTALTVKVSKTTLKRSKKKQSVKLIVNTNSRGKISYSTDSNSKKLKKYISVSKNGVVTIKKKAPKGTYKVKVTAAAKGNFKSATKVVKIKVK